MSEVKRVAIVGASRDRSKFGNKAVRAFSQSGYKVYPIHPTEKEIEGLSVCPSINDVPEPIEKVSLYLPPSIGIKLLPDIAKKRPSELWLNPGAESPAIFSEAKSLGLNVIAGCSIVALGLSPSDFP